MPMTSFQPSWWCRGAHFQTIAGALFRPKPAISFERRRIELPDRDFLDLDFLATNRVVSEKAPVILILHGLEGSSKAPYVQCLLAAIAEREAIAIVMHQRGCSGEINRLQQTYHSGKTDDLNFVVDQLAATFAGRDFYLVGYSIGGNIVLKWLGEKKEAARQKIKKAVAVSVPYDLKKSVSLLDRGFNRAVYTHLLLKRLKEKMYWKQKKFPDLIRYDLLRTCKTFWEFDNLVTAPLNGFKDAIDYWTKSSCQSFLKYVRVPALLIHAEDDPFFIGEFLPREEIQKSPTLQTLFVPHGGHPGFVSGKWPWRQQPWLEKNFLYYLKPVLFWATPRAAPTVV